MTNHESISVGASQKVSGRVTCTGAQLIGAASLVAAGCCACWLRSGQWMPAVSPLRALGLLVVGAYLVSATLLLLDEP